MSTQAFFLRRRPSNKLSSIFDSTLKFLRDPTTEPGLYRVMNVNLVLSILFLVIIEICFGLNFDNAKLCAVSFCFGGII